MSRNTRIQAMHVTSANAWAANTDVAYVPGTTLFLDYSYWRHLLRPFSCYFLIN